MRIGWECVELGVAAATSSAPTHDCEPATPTEMDNLLFLDNFNFHPASGIPAIGRGISVNGITTDMAMRNQTSPRLVCCRTTSLRNAANGLALF
jgi:hypothetical protein